jgi:SAM-dependent methyltransferase
LFRDTSLDKEETMTTGPLAVFEKDNYDIAEAIAPTWERRREEIERACAPIRNCMLNELGPQDGDTVLELAAGLGDTGFEAAEAIGKRGRLITTDLSPAMVDAARRRGEELGLTNVTYEVMDAERLTLETDSVDGVLCRFGYMLMPNYVKALAETRRVLRPCGRVALASWGPLERNPFFGLIGMSLGQRGHIPPPEPPPAPGPFSMATPERTAALLEGAGFTDVRTEEVPVRFSAADVDGYVSLIADIAGPLALAVRALPEAELAVVKAELEDAFPQFAVADGFELPGVALCAVAS